MLRQYGEETVKPTARLGADLDQTFSNTLFSINTQTFELTQLAGGDDCIMNGIAWAADGQRVFYMADGGIYAAKDDGSCWALVAELENMVTFVGRQNLVLSLDGNLVALMCADSLGVSKIWAANLIEGSTIDSTTVTTYTYDAANRLTSVGGMAYTWDDRGNLIHDGVFTYTYNAAGRMVRAQSLTSTLVYTYNAAGLRVVQSVDGDEITFAWDWALPLPQVLATSDGALDVYGLARIGELRDSAWSYSLEDELRSVRQWADGSGYVTYAAGHTPFGEYLWQDGSTDSAWGYTGERRDSSVGVIYLRARWYRPSEGRFSQKDPWEGNQKQPLTMNPYLYVLANPVGYVDPAGWYPIEPFGGVCQEKKCVIHPVVTFIIDRMREDAASREIKHIRRIRFAQGLAYICIGVHSRRNLS